MMTDDDKTAFSAAHVVAMTRFMRTFSPEHVKVGRSPFSYGFTAGFDAGMIHMAKQMPADAIERVITSAERYEALRRVMLSSDKVLMLRFMDVTTAEEFDAICDSFKDNAK